MLEWERNLLATGNSEISAEEGGYWEPYENGEGGWSYRLVIR